MLLSVCCAALVLAACGESERPDGRFEVRQSRGSRSERVEPGRAPAESGAAKGGAAMGGAPSSNGALPAAPRAGLSWQVPPAFVPAEMPAGFAGIYLDFCRLPKEGAETHDGILVTSVSTGDLAANVARWKGQLPEGRVVREGPFEIPAASGAPLRGTLLEMEGPTYAMRGSLWEEGPPTPIRAIFAAIEGPSGLLTLRYVGPPAGGERAAAPIRALIDSVRRADASSGGGAR